MSPFATIVALIGVVVIVASLLSGLIERSRVPVVVVFLGLGLLLGPVGLGLVDIGFDSPALIALATLALALVLFSDAVTLNLGLLARSKRLLLRVLGPGTLVPAILIAAAAMGLLGLPLPAAAILGAALASTDPVLLRTVLRSRSLSDTARTALRIESGMNDIVLLPIVVLSVLALGGAAHGGEAHGLDGKTLARSLLGLFLLGPGVGALIGWAGISALVFVRDRVGVRRDYESLYALGLAFTAYAAAEAVGGSGFVAAFAAGLLVAAQDVELCDCFLEYGEATAEILLLLTFVALGATLIWSGLDVIDGPTLLFALIALAVRTLVLFPVLKGMGTRRDRWFIALLGPRGLSSLLLVLLAVFAGVADAERLFAITCLVVLLSVVVHGALIAVLMRPEAAVPATAGTLLEPGAVVQGSARDVPLTITLDEARALHARGERVLVADVRREKAYAEDPRRAPDVVRLSPEDPLPDARAHHLPKDATIVAFCNCPDEATSLRVTHELRRAGWSRARALIQGWKVWTEAGMTLEAKPSEGPRTAS